MFLFIRKTLRFSLLSNSAPAADRPELAEAQDVSGAEVSSFGARRLFALFSSV